MSLKSVVGPVQGQKVTDAATHNRVLRWRVTGIEYEADPRQAEKLVYEFQLFAEQKRMQIWNYNFWSRPELNFQINRCSIY